MDQVLFSPELPFADALWAPAERPYPARKSLIALAETMQTARANDIKERKVAADERKLKLMEEREARAIKKLDQETEKLTKKASHREITIADINRIRERTFGLPPVSKGA